MFPKLHQVVQSQWFEFALFSVLIVESGVLSLQIFSGDVQTYGALSSVLIGLIVVLLSFENLVGLITVWPQPWQYFYRWDNLLSCGLLFALIQFPEHPYIALFRLPRVLRLTKTATHLSWFKGLMLLKVMRQSWRSKAALTQHRRLLQVIFDRIPVMLIIWEAEGDFQLVNNAAQRILAWSPEQLPTAELWTVLYPDLFQYRRLQTWKQTANGQWQDFTTHRLDAQIRELSWAFLPLWDDLYLAIGQDITAQKQLEAQLRWQATHDALTQLLNRQAFETELDRVLARQRRHSQPHVLCCLDLDRFKVINDTCGHVAGDEALRQVATLLQNQLGPSHTLARLGGDEFGLLLKAHSLNQGQAIAQTLLDTIRDYRFIWQGQRFKLGVSIGLVELVPTERWSKDALVLADAACYVAKYNGRNCIHVYGSDDEKLSQQQGDRRWSHCIQTALENNRFYLYAQEIMPLATGQTWRFHEILLRLVDETGQHVGAQGFLPTAERCDLMPDLDRWVIEHFITVCFPLLMQTPQDSESLHLEHQNIKNYYTINLSGASINSEPFCEFLKDILQAHPDFAPLICFEVTETVAIANLTQATQFMAQIKALGCKFALDDFGSGMSSLDYLQSLPVDYLKIDGLFIKDIVHNPVHQVMVEGCHQIAHMMGLETIAEHVENEATLTRLRQIGIDYVQGYAIARPDKLVLF